MKRPLFIVFEGIDCSGTSTQAQLLSSGLRRLGNRVLMTSEPSQGPIGQLIRTYFSERLSMNFDRAAQDKFFGSLFAADRLDHVFNPTDGVLKQLSDGVTVVCTRYKYSSLAYNAENEEERNFILAANSALPEPHALIYLRSSVELSLQRMRGRVVRETYEKDELKLRTALYNFEREMQVSAAPKLVLDASSEPQILASRILEFILIQEKAQLHD